MTLASTIQLETQLQRGDLGESVPHRGYRHIEDCPPDPQDGSGCASSFRVVQRRGDGLRYGLWSRCLRMVTFWVLCGRLRRGVSGSKPLALAWRSHTRRVSRSTG